MHDAEPGATALSDDEPVVVLSGKIQPRIGKSRGRGRPPEQARALAQDAVEDFDKARTVIRDVNRNRMLIAKRLANLNLFPQNEVEANEWRAKPMPSDTPQISILWQLKAELTSARDIEDAYQRTQCRTTLLTKMADVINKCTEEAGKASDEWRKILEARASLEVRQKEHLDKMEMERAKLASRGNSDIDVAEVERIANGAP